MDWALWIYRELYWCRRALIKKFCPIEEEYTKLTVHANDLPWLWIGIKCPDESIITSTYAVGEQVRYGTHVTVKYLENITGLTDGVWMYIDSKTLEEKEFPSEGFVIEDVSGKSVHHS